VRSVRGPGYEDFLKTDLRQRSSLSSVTLVFPRTQFYTSSQHDMVARLHRRAVRPSLSSASTGTAPFPFRRPPFFFLYSVYQNPVLVVTSCRTHDGSIRAVTTPPFPSPPFPKGAIRPRPCSVRFFPTRTAPDRDSSLSADSPGDALSPGKQVFQLRHPFSLPVHAECFSFMNLTASMRQMPLPGVYFVGLSHRVTS